MACCQFNTTELLIMMTFYFAVKMSLKLFADAVHFLTPKTPDQNFIAAAFYMLSVSLVSMSMVHMNWFLIHAPPCLPYIALSDFFVLTSDIQDMTS